MFFPYYRHQLYNLFKGELAAAAYNVCILDSIDDLLMLHGLEFVGVKVDGDPNKLVSAAIVMRRLDNLQEFYSHDSTLFLIKTQ
jgi:hypothetical protein